MLSTITIMLLAAPVAFLTGYFAGRAAAQTKTSSWRPIFQLVDHRARCLGHERPRLARELGERLAIPPWAWDELLAIRRPLDRRPERRGDAEVRR
jgi:hypothetical protein